MTKITNEMIEQINELYAQIKVKAKVARELGISASTVSKYLIPNYVPIEKRNITTFSGNVKPVQEILHLFLKEYGTMGELCSLSVKEKEELVELQKEVSV